MRKLGVVAAAAVTLTALAATGAHAGAGTASPLISGLHDPGRIAGRYIVVL